MRWRTNTFRNADARGVYSVALVLVFLGTQSILPLHGADVRETYDDGKLKAQYRTDPLNRKTGNYEEFYPNGKIKVRGQYSAGKKNGRWQMFSDAAKPSETINYRNDLLEGAYTWNLPTGRPGLRATYRMGQLAGPLTVLDDKGRVVRFVNYPRPREMVEKMFATLYFTEKSPVKFTSEPKVSAPYKSGTLSSETLDAALKVTKLYRCLSGLPYEEMKVDPALCEKSAAGAVILAKIGSLTHKPDRPADMDAGYYSLAFTGCSEDNLFMGSGNPVDAVRGFMDDSDSSNVDRIGHRQWVLSPGLHNVGFGSAQRFVSMHVFDGARKVKFDFNFISFPGEGYYPTRLIEPHYAWSLHFNASKVKLGAADTLKITLQKLDEHYQSSGDVIATKIISTPDAMSATFGWRVIVFKPELTEIAPARYWVEVAGVKSSSGADAPFGYIVEFIDMPSAQASAGSN